MSTGPDPQGAGRAPTEEELRAAYEAELKKIRVEQVLLEQVVTLVNLGMRRTGLSPGTEDERDVNQVRLAIEAIRLQMPLLEQVAPAQAAQIRDALSQLQLAFVRLGGPAEAGPSSDQPGAGPEEPASAVAGSDEPGTAAHGSGVGEGPAQAPGTGAEPQPDPSKPGEPGPAQRSGRLWVPGQ
jgi:hypothetical protein